MKKYLIIILFSFIVWNTIAQKNSYEIKVNVSQISSDEGKIIAKLYNSKENFLDTAIEKKVAIIEDGNSTLVFQNVEEGTYAIAIIHDENGNDKIDFNFLGIPSESLAASNNAKAFFVGPPSFADAKFELKGKSVIQNIQM